MDAVVRVVVVVSICAFITRINYDDLDVVVQWQPQPPDRFLSLEVRVRCGAFDVGQTSPSERAMVEKAVEDSFNRVYLSQYGDYLSYVGWKGSTTKAGSREGLVTNHFQTTMVHSGDKVPPESFMKRKLHTDWEAAFRELLYRLDVDKELCLLELVDPRDKRLGARRPKSLPPSSVESNASNAEERRLE